jgi:hypothetical protein
MLEVIWLENGTPDAVRSAGYDRHAKNCGYCMPFDGGPTGLGGSPSNGDSTEVGGVEDRDLVDDIVGANGLAHRVRSA